MIARAAPQIANPTDRRRRGPLRVPRSRRSPGHGGTAADESPPVARAAAAPCCRVPHQFPQVMDVPNLNPRSNRLASAIPARGCTEGHRPAHPGLEDPNRRHATPAQPESFARFAMKFGAEALAGRYTIRGLLMNNSTASYPVRFESDYPDKLGKCRVLAESAGPPAHGAPPRFPASRLLRSGRSAVRLQPARFCASGGLLRLDASRGASRCRASAAGG